jgi:hypothetical protein
MDNSLIPTAGELSRRIVVLRGQPVLFDRDLAELYGVTTKALNQSVRRNAARFPEDFMFLVGADELDLTLRSRSQIVALYGRGHNIKYPPLAFTEYGVAMLSSVLRSERAVQVNIAIMRMFGRLRGLAYTHADLARRLTELEEKVVQHDDQFRAVFHEIRKLLLPAAEPPRRRIGFIQDRGPGPTSSKPSSRKSERSRDGRRGL